MLVSVTVCGLGGQEIKSRFFSKGFFSGRTFFTQGLKIIGEKHAGNLRVGESIAQKKLCLGALCLISSPCALKCKPWGLVLKKYRQVGRWVASLDPARIASLCSMKIGLSMTVRYRGHHCTQLRLGVTQSCIVSQI